MKKSIPLIKPDLPHFSDISSQFEEILASGKITNFGKYVSEFEREAGAYLGTHVVTLSSGTMGLLFVLQALGVVSGKKVIIPSFTFMATAQAIQYAGGTPVFAEVDDDLTLSVSDLEQLLDLHPDVAVVLPVHMYGLPCRTDEIQAVVDASNKRNGQSTKVIYDAAHAFGSARGDRKVGTFGDAEIFSLSVTKVLVSVEGGMVSSHNEDLIARIRKMRNYGIEENYDTWYPGLNGKMSEFHAAIGTQNLRRIDTYMRARQERAARYSKLIREKTSFQMTSWPAGVRHTFKDFSILLSAQAAPQRPAVISFLKEQGVETRAYFYPPVHEQRYFKHLADRPLPATESLSRRVLTLPFYTSMTDDEMDYVIEALVRVESEVLQAVAG